MTGRFTSSWTSALAYDRDFLHVMSDQVERPTFRCVALVLMRAASSQQTVQMSSLSQTTMTECALLNRLLQSSLVLAEEWEAVSEDVRQSLLREGDAVTLLRRLVERQLLTPYQAAQIGEGKLRGLMLGNYRVLDCLGEGGIGVVYKAEHVLLRRLVAVKVVPVAEPEKSRVLQRFFIEMRVLARLHHPNIVLVFDAGALPHPESKAAMLHYLVMEYVEGQDLEKHVQELGPLPAASACDLIYQVASALDETHRQGLIHRDVKPSNILITVDGQAKLLDFGLARHFRQRLTDPGFILGTADYMSPEQASDARSVDIRTDIYGLGGTLYWCLTGETPFSSEGSLLEIMVRRLHQPPPCARRFHPELPPALDDVIARMMALKQEDRYATPHAVMRGLLPFLSSYSGERQRLSAPTLSAAQPVATAPAVETKVLRSACRVLIVDDDPVTRLLCRTTLENQQLLCDEAANGKAAWDALQSGDYDLVLSDIDMPEMTGPELLRRLRSDNTAAPFLKVALMSGSASTAEMAALMLAGADDYLAKPLSDIELIARARTLLNLKAAQEHLFAARSRTEQLNQHLLIINAELERNLLHRDSDLAQARNAMVMALASLLQHRTSESELHLRRIQRYVRCLAEAAIRLHPSLQDRIDEGFMQMLECCAPLHDIGFIALPDYILNHPGRLDGNEQMIMQSHTTIGADTLLDVARRHGTAVPFLTMAVDVARHHHERHDGTGYPDRLAGADIPLAAQIVAIADGYDAIRSKRTYRPAMSHVAALQILTEASPGHYDPEMLAALDDCSAEFSRIFRQDS